MSWHRYLVIDASFELAVTSGRSAKRGRSRRAVSEIPNPDDVARKFIAKVGRPRFGGFVVREAKYTAVRPGLQLIRQLIRMESSRRTAVATGRRPAAPRRRLRRRSSRS